MIVRVKKQSEETLEILTKELNKKPSEVIDLALTYLFLQVNTKKAMENPLFRYKVKEAELLLDAIKKGELK